LRVVHDWWVETAARDGVWSTAQQLLARLWNFVRESMPDRRRQRYGDVDYDWDYRVNTTGATVGWHDRLLGEFLSAYQPTEPGLFHEILANLKIDFAAFTFIDLGSGKGRTLLMAADYPFRRVLGVELLPDLNRVAQENIGQYHSNSQKCFRIESLCQDARTFEFPPEPVLLYLFHPLPEAGLRQVMVNLEKSLARQPRPVYVLYHNPVLEHVLAETQFLRKFSGALHCSIYEGRS
jgi:SAM-dependent methyltransferase